MTSMDDRGKTLENKYAHDQERLFKIEARTCKLVGQWAAEKMSLTGDEASTYAQQVVASNLDEPGFGDVIHKILKDFTDKKISVSEAEIEKAFEKNIKLAIEQFENEK